MSEERHARVKKLFLEACRRPTDARRKFLEQACDEDPALLEEVESLLLHHDGIQTREPSSLSDREQQLGTVPPKVIGHYRVLQKLGEGGMGEVYEAHQEEPVRRRVAIKIIKWGMDTKEVVARFESERQALALMNHPNIAKVFEAGATDEGRPYFAMEFVPGVSITEYCDTNRLSTHERLELFVEVCHGVQHAHQKSVIHRDMKPSNVLVTVQDGKPVPKIIDFGVAKATAQRLTERTLFTELGQWIGTPEYMSPEQAEMTGLDIDTRTDVYSLGVLLYELLVGQQPFGAKELRDASFDEMRRKIREEEPTRPSTKISHLGAASETAARNRRTELPALTRELRGDLDWITMKALEKDRTRRYGSPDELAADVERHLRHEPVLAGPPSTTYRVGKFIRRHRVGVIAGTLVVGALVAGIVGTTIGLLRARKEAESARLAAEVLQQTFGSLNPRRRGFAQANREDLLDRGVETIKTKLAGQPLVRAGLVRTLGYAYMELGHYVKARPLFDEAIAIHRDHLGMNHPEYALSISFLGDLLAQVGNLDEAQALHEEALAIREQSLGHEHLTIAWSLRSLGTVHRLKVEIEIARKLFQRALEVGEKAVGPNDYDVSLTLDAFAGMEMDAGKFRAAQPLFERALRIREETRGPEHPEFAHTLGGLGRLHFWMGKYEKSLSAYERTGTILEKNYSPDHPLAAQLLTVKADLYRHIGRYDEAHDLYQRALDILERTLGPDHLELSQCLHGLGSLHLVRGDNDRARRTLERAQKIVTEYRRRSRGTSVGAGLAHDVSYYPSILNMQGVLHARAGEIERARAAQERALELSEEALGSNHPLLAWPLKDLGELHRDTGDYEQARSHLDRALKIRTQALGNEHALVAEIQHSLAVLHYRTGNHDRSRELFKSALKVGEKTLGPLHPFVEQTLKDYAELLHRVGQSRRAEELESRAAAIEAERAK